MTILNGWLDTFNAGSGQFLSFSQLFRQLFFEFAGDREEAFEGLFGLSDELGFGDQRLSLFGSDLLSQLGHFVFHKVLDDCLVSNFSFQLFVDLPLGVGDDPFDHFILLVHFSGFEGLDLSQFGFLS